MIRQPGANANPYVPIIMLTGHSEKKRVIAARDAGITEFMAKPISAKALYQRILNVVANPRPFIKTKTYFGPDRRRNVNSNYVGPERRKGGKADVIAPDRRCSTRPRSPAETDQERHDVASTKDDKPSVADLSRDHEVITPPNKLRKAVSTVAPDDARRRPGGARRAGAGGSSSSEFSSLDGHRVRAARRARASSVKAEGLHQDDARGAVPRRPRHQGRGRDLRLPWSRTLADSLCRLIEHTPDMTRIPLALVDQHVDAVRAIFRESARPDVATLADALDQKLREVTDEFLAHENQRPARLSRRHPRAAAGAGRVVLAGQRTRSRRSSPARDPTCCARDGALRLVRTRLNATLIAASRRRQALHRRGGSIASLATSSSQNMRASSRAASAAKRRSSVSSGSMSPSASSAQRVSTRSTMRRLSRVAAARLADEAALAHGLDRLAERRIGRGRQPGLVVERAEAGAAPVVHQRAHARERHAGQLGQRLLEHVDIAGQQRAQHQAGGELAALAQMPDQRPDLVVAGDRRERDGRLLAGLLGDALGVVLVQPVARRRRSRRASRTAWRPAPAGSPPAGRRAPACASRIAARWPKRATMRSSENGAISALRVLDQHQAGLGGADLGDRGGDRARQVGAARDRGLQSAAGRWRPHRPDRRRAAAANARAPSSRFRAGRRRARGSPAAARLRSNASASRERARAPAATDRRAA